MVLASLYDVVENITESGLSKSLEDIAESGFNRCLQCSGKYRRIWF